MQVLQVCAHFSGSKGGGLLLSLTGTRNNLFPSVCLHSAIKNTVWGRRPFKERVVRKLEI